MMTARHLTPGPGAPGYPHHLPSGGAGWRRCLSQDIQQRPASGQPWRKPQPSGLGQLKLATAGQGLRACVGGGC